MHAYLRGSRTRARHTLAAPFPPTFAPESMASRCADGYTPAHPTPPPPPGRHRMSVSRRTASCCRRPPRTESRSACSRRSRASASCSAAVRRRLAPGRACSGPPWRRSGTGSAARPLRGVVGREGVVGRASEVLDGGAVGEALGAGGDEGEDHYFNVVVIHLREPFGVNVEQVRDEVAADDAFWDQREGSKLSRASGRSKLLPGRFCLALWWL